MTSTPTREIPFTEDETSAVTAVIDQMLSAGKGWVNFSPELDAEDTPPPRSLGAWLFSARGEPVPLATWTVPEHRGGRVTIGISHGAGPKALVRLAGDGHPLPAGWLKLTDHARRGLVVAVPPDVEPEEAISWMLAACHRLCALPLTGHWLATAYEP